MNTELKRAFESGNVQLFVGSGLSLDYFRSADSFRDKIIDSTITIKGKDTTLRKFVNNKDLSLEDSAEYYEQYTNSSELIKMVRTTFSEKINESFIHQQLWKLPNINIIYTTNYDCLLEDAFSDPFQEPIVITRYSDIDYIDPSKKIVFKPHGCARKSTKRKEFVISRNDYLKYSERKPLEILKTLYDISTKCFVFLGYSLKDNNIRHIIADANKKYKVRAFAVLPEFDEFNPEADYWDKQGIEFLKMNDLEFINYVAKDFPIDSSEWSDKINLRIDHKSQIAGKAFNLLNGIVKKENINIIFDSGTTVLLLARLIMNGIKNDNMSADKISITTNSPPIVNEFCDNLRSTDDRRVEINVIGGPLRYQTQAFIPNDRLANCQIEKLQKSNKKTIAFIGATMINKKGLFTKTKEETYIKKKFIEIADKIYVLADHSKEKEDDSSFIFSALNEKINLITDRKNSFLSIKDLIGEIII